MEETVAPVRRRRAHWQPPLRVIGLRREHLARLSGCGPSATHEPAVTLVVLVLEPGAPPTTTDESAALEGSRRLIDPTAHATACIGCLRAPSASSTATSSGSEGAA